MTNAQRTAFDDAAALVAALQAQWRARLVETHISWVLLDGTVAWKIKKPVQLGFLDFSHLATRYRLCEAELTLNRRLAPQLYLDVVAIYGRPEAPTLDRSGPPIEYALRMQQFPDGALWSEQLASGQLRPAHMDALARRLARFHDEAPVADAASPYGTPEQASQATLRTLDALAQVTACREACAHLRPWLEAQVQALVPLWRQRKADGHVLEGHGDLHLANLVVLGDEVTAFDCIEFDPALRWIDPINDIAFTLMDLQAHGRADLGFRFLNAYLDERGDHAGLPSLPYYVAYRALVRALVARLRAGPGEHGAPPGPDYLALALQCSQPQGARLLITHGVSGSGKSFVTQKLLEGAQAIRLRSDVERKRLFGLRPLSASQAGPIYGQDASQRTYARLRAGASAALRAGYPVIVDATFLRASDRKAFRQLADELNVPFSILHCRAPHDALVERIRARQARGDDASEADVRVLTQQLARQEALCADEQAHEITVDTTARLAIADLVARWFAAS